jgi:hypothetical protein
MRFDREHRELSARVGRAPEGERQSGLSNDHEVASAPPELPSDALFDFDFQPAGDELKRAIERLIATLNTFYPDQEGGVLGITSLRMLATAGLGERQIQELSDLVEGQVTEQAVAIAFLAALPDTEVGQALSRHVHRLIRQAAKNAGITAPLQARIAALTTSWGVS